MQDLYYACNLRTKFGPETSLLETIAKSLGESLDQARYWQIEAWIRGK